MRLNMNLTEAIDGFRAITTRVDNLFGKVFTGTGAGDLQVYVTEVHEVEGQLRNIFADHPIILALYSDHYFYLLTATGGPRANYVLRSEIERLKRSVSDAVAQLRALEPFVKRPGLIVVPDTNALLQCERFDQMSWTDEIGESPIRLVLPMPVIREIDSKKYSGRGDLAKRAISVQRTIFDRLADLQSTGSAEIRKGVTLELFRPPIESPSQASVDESILEQALLLQRIAGADHVKVATRDMAMHISAHDHGISTHWMSEKYWLPREERTPQQVQTSVAATSSAG